MRILEARMRKINQIVKSVLGEICSKRFLFLVEASLRAKRSNLLRSYASLWQSRLPSLCRWDCHASTSFRLAMTDTFILFEQFLPKTPRPLATHHLRLSPYVKIRFWRRFSTFDEPTNCPKFGFVSYASPVPTCFAVFRLPVGIGAVFGRANGFRVFTATDQRAAGRNGRRKRQPTRL